MEGAMASLRRRVDGESPVFVAMAVFAVLFALYVPTAEMTFRGQVNDTYATVVPAARLAEHGTLDLSATRWADTSTWFEEVAGGVYSNRFPGAILAAVPFYWLIPTSQPVHPLPGALAAATLAAAAMAVLFLVLRRVAPQHQAAGASLVAGVATSTWAVSADALWTHTPGQLWLALALLGLAAARWLPAGLALGAAVLTRPHTAVAAAVAGIGVSWRPGTDGDTSASTSGGRVVSWRRLLLVGLGSAVGLGLYLAYNQLVLAAGGAAAAEAGTNVVTGGYGAGRLDQLLTQPLDDFAVNVAGSLLAPSRGLFVGSPFLIVLVPGLRRAWRAAPCWVRAAAGGGVAYQLVQLRVNTFSGGWNLFVYRHGLELLTLSAPLLLLAYRLTVADRPLRRRIFWALAALAALIQALGAVVYRRHLDVPGLDPGWGVHEWWWLVQDLGAGGVAVVLAATAVAVTVSWWLAGRSTLAGPVPEAT